MNHEAVTQNPRLTDDYLFRATVRLKALDTLYEVGGWADVVSKSEQVVELALMSLLRHSSVDMRRVHDVSEALLENRGRIPQGVRAHVDKLAKYSRRLRRDRELAFYGSEDLTPTDFYRESDAQEARNMARETVALVKAAFGA